jgi:hypothetical protein
MERYFRILGIPNNSSKYEQDIITEDYLDDDDYEEDADFDDID